ncbi:MAG: FtsQ-type POTRA domain-containing protein [Clostridia bacterium]|nr:FtsQ-type POTRA domain-containing protein [Clostridia bacterium]
MDRNRYSGTAVLPEGFEALAKNSGGRNAGSVRRYVMTRQQRDGWLGAYLAGSKTVDPAALGRTKKARAEFSEDEKAVARKILSALVIVFTVILIAGAAVFVLGRMRIENVAVSGKTGYTSEELMKAAGLDYGDRLIPARIRAADPSASLPLLDSCRIRVSLPGTLTFEVSEPEPVVYAEISGSWFSLSADLKVLEMSESPAGFAEDGLVRVCLPAVSSATSGNRIEFAGGTDGGYVTDFIGTILSSGVADRVDAVFLDSKYGIVMTVDGSYRLFFGSPQNREIKLDAALRIIEEEKAAGTVSAFIDLTDPGTVGVRRLESIDPFSRD